VWPGDCACGAAGFASGRLPSFWGSPGELVVSEALRRNERQVEVEAGLRSDLPIAAEGEEIAGGERGELGGRAARDAAATRRWWP
jgi:hypothetical protein